MAAMAAKRYEVGIDQRWALVVCAGTKIANSPSSVSAIHPIHAGIGSATPSPARPTDRRDGGCRGRRPKRSLARPHQGPDQEIPRATAHGLALPDDGKVVAIRILDRTY
jgi:hypothetical protein